jgi:SagB-type dehydrogenase family enzyme
MNTATKFALGMMGRLRPKPIQASAAERIELSLPQKQGGMPLMEALDIRHSGREFAKTELPISTVSDLLWAAAGFNRTGKGRTWPSAINAQEIDLYVALPSGTYRYDASNNALQLVTGNDIRRVTGYQDFVDEAPLDLVYVADFSRMRLVSATQRESYASVAAGAIAQNVYLFAASAGLETVIRAWIDREALANALGLDHNQHVLLSQTVGFPKSTPKV